MFISRALCLFAIAAFVKKTTGYAADSCDNENLGIINGHTVPIKDAPYMAALMSGNRYKGLSYCGASIIHERFLLTAAHCTMDERLMPVATMGSERTRETNDNTIIEVESFLCHNNFDRDMHNDICLVKLKKPIPFGEKIAKIKLADDTVDVKMGTILNITGWGTTISPDDRERDYPLDLLRTSIPVTSHKCCQKRDNSINDKMLCAGVKGRGGCVGDSGGPLTFNDVQVGLLSYALPSHKGDPMCGSGFEVYTKVSSYLDWINSTITQNL